MPVKKIDLKPFSHPGIKSTAGGISRRTFVSAAAAASVAIPAVAISKVEQRIWDETTDVVVVGSGAAGCVAAVTAIAAGAQVVLCEKAGFLGGTTSKSGGAYWIPNNFDLQARGVPDHKEDFLRYVARYSYPSVYNRDHSTLGLPEPGYRLLEAYYDYADEMLQHMATLGALQSVAWMSYDGVSYFPDYQDNLPENATPRGRELGPRLADGSVGSGNDLIAQLTSYLRRANTRMLVDSPVVDLIQEADGKVIGVVVDTEVGTRSIQARRGVVFGSGGYSHNSELVRAYQPGPIHGRCALPTCTGDFIGLATEAGAQLGNMSAAWRVQCVFEQTLLYSSVPDEIWYPVGDSMFVVNKYGRRCVNERSNYHDRTRQSYLWDSNLAEYPNLLSFYIYDRRTAERYAGYFPLPDMPLDEPYVISGDTLESLSAAIDARLESLSSHTGGLRLDASFVRTLKNTFTRFNGYARAGHDPDFERGTHPFDVAWQREELPVSGNTWPDNPFPNQVLHPLSEKGPYFAIIIGSAVLDTNGGPVIDSNAAILDISGKPIPGLYGAGNCVASPAMHAYWGPGSTIGSAMTFGYLAGRNAAARKTS